MVAPTSTCAMLLYITPTNFAIKLVEAGMKARLFSSCVPLGCTNCRTIILGPGVETAEVMDHGLPRYGLLRAMAGLGAVPGPQIAVSCWAKHSHGKKFWLGGLGLRV